MKFNKLNDKYVLFLITAARMWKFRISYCRYDNLPHGIWSTDLFKQILFTHTFIIRVRKSKAHGNLRYQINCPWTFNNFFPQSNNSRLFTLFATFIHLVSIGSDISEVSFTEKVLVFLNFILISINPPFV